MFSLTENRFSTSTPKVATFDSVCNMKHALDDIERQLHSEVKPSLISWRIAYMENLLKAVKSYSATDATTVMNLTEWMSKDSYFSLSVLYVTLLIHLSPQQSTTNLGEIPQWPCGYRSLELSFQKGKPCFERSYCQAHLQCNPESKAQSHHPRYQLFEEVQFLR